jgi:hypothetical protein
MRNIGILLVLIFVSPLTSASANDYIGVSLSGLQQRTMKDVGCEAIAIDRVSGIVVDKTGDIIIFGKKGCEHTITVDDIVVALRGALTPSQPPGVKMVEEYLPGATGVRLIYSGGVAGTSVAQYMTESLSVFYRLSAGTDRGPDGSWPYPDNERIKFDLYPHESGCSSVPGEVAFVLQGPGIMLMTKSVEKMAGIGNDVKQWMVQAHERHEELEELYPALKKLGNFMRLSTLFGKIKDKVDSSRWNFFLQKHRPGRYLHQERLDLDYSEVVIEGVSSRNNYLKCRVNTGLEELVKKVLSARAEADEDVGFAIDFSGERYCALDNFTTLVQRLKEVDMFEKSIFIDIGFKETVPVLKTIYAKQLYTNRTYAAKSFSDLVKSAIHEAGDTNRHWAAFYKEFLSEKRFLGDHKPALVIVSNDVTPGWENLNKIDPLMDQFTLYLVPRNDLDFIAASLEFTVAFNEIPRVGEGKMGIIVSYHDESLVLHLNSLRNEIGKKNILINPTMDGFLKFLGNRSFETLFIDVDFIDGCIKLKDGELGRFEILNLNRFDNIKYLAFGYFGTNSRKSWNWEILRIFSKKGAGLISLTRQGFDEKDVKKRISGFTELLKGENYNYLRTSSLSQVLSPNGKTMFWKEIPQ